MSKVTRLIIRTTDHIPIAIVGLGLIGTVLWIAGVGTITLTILWSLLPEI